MPKRKKNSDKIYSIAPVGYLTERNVEEKTFEEVKNSTAKDVKLDLTKTTFMNSQGIVYILKMFKLCKKLGKRFYIYKPIDEVRHLLGVTNMDKIIPIVE